MPTNPPSDAPDPTLSATAFQAAVQEAYTNVQSERETPTSCFLTTNRQVLNYSEGYCHIYARTIDTEKLLENFPRAERTAHGSRVSCFRVPVIILFYRPNPQFLFYGSSVNYRNKSYFLYFNPTISDYVNFIAKHNESACVPITNMLGTTPLSSVNLSALVALLKKINQYKAVKLLVETSPF